MNILNYIVNWFKKEDSIDNLRDICEHISDKNYLRTLNINKNRIFYIENIKTYSCYRFNIRDYINDLVKIKTEKERVKLPFLKDSSKFFNEKLEKSCEFYDEKTKTYYYKSGKTIYSTNICLYKIEYY
jgi:hypothetical protein